MRQQRHQPPKTHRVGTLGTGTERYVYISLSLSLCVCVCVHVGSYNMCVCVCVCVAQWPVRLLARWCSAGCPPGEVHVKIDLVEFPQECGWSIKLPGTDRLLYSVRYGSYTDIDTFHTCHALPPGPYVFSGVDIYADGWHGGTFTVSYERQVLVGPIPVTGSITSSVFTVPGIVSFALGDCVPVSPRGTATFAVG